MISKMTQFAFLSKLKSCSFCTKMYRVHSIRDISLIYPYNLYQQFSNADCCTK